MVWTLKYSKGKEIIPVKQETLAYFLYVGIDCCGDETQHKYEKAN